MSDYNNFTLRAVDVGLNLRETPDAVKEGFWTRLNNIDPSQEASISTRGGRAVEVTGTSLASVHSIKRISDSALVVGAGTSVYVNSVLATGGFSGNPLSMISFKPPGSSSSWIYIGDSAQLRKIKSDGTVYNWGIVAPTVSASFGAAAGVGNLDSSISGGTVYDWRFTYYSTSTGAESNGSPTATGASVVAHPANVSVVASTDPQVDQIRLYRRGGVNGGNVWRFTLTAPNATATLLDDNSDSTIALNEPLLEDNDVPFSTVDSSGNTLSRVPLPYLAGPFIGKYIIACGDPNRPGYAYWTNAEMPDSASVDNNVQVTGPREPLIAALIYASQPFVWSRQNLYALDYGGPAEGTTFTPRLTPCGKGLATPWAFDVGDEIFFLAADGIYSTNGQTPATSLTEDTIRPIFEGVNVSGFSPVDYTFPAKLRLQVVGKELHFLYQDTSGILKHMIYHLLYKRWGTASTSGINVTTVYSDENQSQVRPLLGANNGNIYLTSRASTTDSGTAIAVTARTGSLDFGIPNSFKEFGNLIIDADPAGGTITVTPYYNTELEVGTTSFTLTGTGRQKFTFSLAGTFDSIPEDRYAYSIALDFSWSGAGSVYQAEILWRPDEELVKHWEFPATSHGMSGWQHVRDMYVCLRSSSDTTLVVEIDGFADGNDSYVIPSTNGHKRKTLVNLRARKGKLFRYRFDSSIGFRVYGEDSEVRVKEWNTALGYRLVSPLQASGGGT